MRKKSIYISLIVLIFDQLIKYIVDSYMYIGNIKTIIPKFFYVTKVYNNGAAWSILKNNHLFLIVFSILALILLIKYQSYFKINKRNIYAFGFIYGGLFGNLIDRIRLGYVIDYFKINLFNFPIFNIADIAIVIGFILMFIAIIKGEDKSESRKRKRKNR